METIILLGALVGGLHQTRALTVPVADLRWANPNSLGGGGDPVSTLTTQVDPQGNRVLSNVTAANTSVGGNRVYWDAAKTLRGVGGIIEVRFLFTDSTTTQKVGVAPVGGVEYDPDAGQSGTTDMGPGTVNLLTGAYDLSATDASAFGISLTRTASSRRTMAGRENPAAAAFGPQWVLGGVDDDLELAWRSIRQTSDFSLDLLDASGEATSFVVDDAGTTWYAANGDEDLRLVPSGGSWSATTPFGASTWTLSDDDGTVTTFASRTEVGVPTGVSTSNNLQASWQVDSVLPAVAGSNEALQRNATRYRYEPYPSTNPTTMRLSRIGAANPSLTVTEQQTCLTASTPAPGCRVLALTWAVPSGMTSSAENTRVTAITLFAGDPATNTVSPLTMATYGYSSAGYLTSMTDPRSGLTTGYTYKDDYSASNGAGTVTVPGQVATLTPPGQRPWTFSYGSVASTNDTGLTYSAGRLLQVSRDTLTPGTQNSPNGTANWNLVYSVPLDTTAYGPYPMSAQAAATWGQDSPPLDATAVFGPTAGGDARAGDADAGNDQADETPRNWSTAAVTYQDVNGHTVNVASPSAAAGRWVGSGTWSGSASSADNIATVTAAGLDSTRNGAGNQAANGTTGTNPPAGTVAIPVKGARITASLVDDAGNTTMSLTAANRALALGQDDPGVVATGGPTAAGQIAALSVVPSGASTPAGNSDTPDLRTLKTWQRAQLLASLSRFEPSTSTFTDGPQATAPALIEVASVEPLKLTMTRTDPSSSGSVLAIPARAITLSRYDDGRPSDGTATASNLSTYQRTGFVAGTGELMSATTSVRYRDTTDNTWKLREDPAAYYGSTGVTTAALKPIDVSLAHDLRYTQTQYQWVGPAAGKVSYVKTSAAAAGVTETRTWYDVLGRPIATSMPRSPGSAASPDTSPSTTTTRYYGPSGTAYGSNNCTADPTATSNYPALFGGMVCTTGPDNLSGITTPGLPTTATSYTRTGQAAVTTESIMSTRLRSTTTGYDPADRPTTVSVATFANLGVTAGTEAKTLAYDGMGNPVTTNDGTRTVTSGYDTLGRLLTFTDATGLKTDTRYDNVGRVASTVLSDLVTDTAALGYNAQTSGKTWTQTNIFDPVTGDMTSTSDTAPSGQANTGLASMTFDVEARPVEMAYPAGFGTLRKRTVYDTTGSAVRRVVTAGTTTVLDEANAHDLSDFGGGENTYGQQVESRQQLTAIPLTAAGEPTGTAAANVVTQTRDRRYSYDGLGRLTAAADSRTPNGASTVSCTVRAWAFDADSNQTGKNSATTSGVCAGVGYTVPGVTATYTYNALDQITDSGYSYDGLGRTRTVPVNSLPATTAVGATGTGLSVTYAPGDMVATQSLAVTNSGTTGTETQAFMLDPTGDRLLSATTNLPSAGSKPAVINSRIVNRYNDSDDNPTLLNEADGSVSRYVTGPDADLAATVTLRADGTSGLTWNIANLHGDLAAVLPDSASVSAVQLAASDEFGLALDGIPDRNNAAATRYDYLGAKQRSTNARAGLTLMGARLYNPTVGRFLSIDAIPGGNANAYSYVTDPINSFDLDGQFSVRKIARKIWKKGLGYGASAGKWAWKNRDNIGLVLGVAGMLGCAACGVASLAIGAVSAGIACNGAIRGRGGKVSCGLGLASVATGGGGLGLAKLASRFSSAGKIRLSTARWYNPVKRLAGHAYIWGSRQARRGSVRLGWSSVGFGAAGIPCNYRRCA